MGLLDMQILAVLTDNESRELRQILQEAGFSHARTSRRGINTIFNHFRDKAARFFRHLHSSPLESFNDFHQPLIGNQNFIIVEN
ncbi:hypothetical protein COS86_08870 [Candidatus Bathyarchaeota archaeon CG07_land_8_20_14_0_80_47_9]|nr:MAG: hypothetical protein COS86_08870 [Candidatus Bathyarchaeota archaeon CG07_land_8_20_14_0_80_47_9]